jgi:hypothetical protein
MIHWEDLDTINEERERIEKIEATELWSPSNEILTLVIKAPYEQN